MRVINLTRGPGNGINTACLMTASNILIGRGQDGDVNSCVCLVLRAFIIHTNDAMPEHLLRELYGPLVWEILGTATDDQQVMQARAYAFADWVVREIAPLALRARGLTREADVLASLPPVVDASSARAAYRATIACAFPAARAAAFPAAFPAARAAVHAFPAAVAAARAAADADAESVWRKCPEIIRRVAAIGDKRPVEVCLTEEQLACALKP